MTLRIFGMKSWARFSFSSAVKFLAVFFILLSLIPPAYAHHPSEGEISTTFLEGFLSGLGHPVIGFDHLVFVISIGLLASAVARGIWIPIMFVLAALAGTGLHLNLTLVDMPIVEVVISVSVIAFGILLAKLEKPNVAIMAGMAGVAGLFHGYAYGEAILGAAAVPLTAYLIGFTLIQTIIALSAYKVAIMVQKSGVARPDFLRFAGYISIGFGLALLAAQ